VIYEPVMAVGGMIVPPLGYGAQLRDLATRCGALLIMVGIELEQDRAVERTMQG